MLPYFLVFIWIGCCAILGTQRWSPLTSFGLWLLFTLFIGLRIEVGTDWDNYLGQFQDQVAASLDEVISLREPGYALVNWVSARFDWDIYGVNIICAGFFSAGLVRYCRRQPSPWLALALSYPYLVVAVAMGYSRQGVAIGLELMALLALERDRLLSFLAVISLAASFHFSALSILFFPIGTARRRLVPGRAAVYLLLFLVSGIGFCLAVLSGLFDYYRSSYIDAEYGAQGAFLRMGLCLLAALVFFWNRRSFFIAPQQRRLYSLIASLTIVASIALPLSPSSTAIDRIALYLLPLQVFVGSRLPFCRVLGLNPFTWHCLLVLLSLAVLSVWFLFAANASFWLPYRNLLFEGML